MKTWKEDNLLKLIKEETEHHVDFNDPNWRQVKSSLVLSNNFNYNDVLDYAKMLVKTAKEVDNVEDWFNYCSEKDTYKDIKRKYRKINAPRIYQNIKDNYEDAKKGIATVSITYLGTLKRLQDQGLIDNLEDLGAYCKFTLK